LIDEAKKKENPDLQSLYEMKVAYQEKVQRLTTAIENKSQEPIPIEEVPILRERLLNLKHLGETFKSILSVNEELEENQANGQKSNSTNKHSYCRFKLRTFKQIGHS